MSLANLTHHTGCWRRWETTRHRPGKSTTNQGQGLGTGACTTSQTAGRSPRRAGPSHGASWWSWCWAGDLWRHQGTVGDSEGEGETNWGYLPAQMGLANHNWFGYISQKDYAMNDHKSSFQSHFYTSKFRFGISILSHRNVHYVVQIENQLKIKQMHGKAGMNDSSRIHVLLCWVMCYGMRADITMVKSSLVKTLLRHWDRHWSQFGGCQHGMIEEW